MSSLRSRKALTFIAFFSLCLGLSAQALPTLKIVVQDETLEFQLDAVTGKDSWVLQHSVDAKRWEDLIFLEQLEVEGNLAIEIARKVLTGGAGKTGFFRAAKLAEKEVLYRNFLESWVKWKTADLSNYSYRVNSNRGGISSNVRYTVMDGEVTSFETISIFPGGVTPDKDVTIDDWFEKIRAAREQGAVTIDVTWHPTLGFPENGFIDLFVELADEEQGWTISEFTPLN